MKAYNVHEIPHIFQLFVRQNQHSFIFDHFILIKECFSWNFKIEVKFNKNFNINISIDEQFIMSMIIYNFIFHSYNIFSDYDYSHQILIYPLFTSLIFLFAHYFWTISNHVHIFFLIGILKDFWLIFYFY
jgi:hypothetical protein